MFQPFEIFNAVVLDKLIELKKIYLVSQTHNRAVDHFADQTRKNILLSDYQDHSVAKIHLAAIRHDPFASLIDCTNPKHLAKLNQMFLPNSKYKLFWTTVKSRKELKKKLDLKYKENIRRYILKNTNWRVAGDETIAAHLEVVFGELSI